MIERQSTALSMQFDPDRLSGTIRQVATGKAWTMDLSAARGVACGPPDPMRAEFPWAQHSRAMGRLRPLRPGDLCAAREREDGVEMAFRVLPLQHLVYHDAIFCLWWELDCYDCPYFRGGDVTGQSLTDLLYGDMPLIFPVGRQYRWAGQGKEAGAIEFEQHLEMPATAAAARRALEVARHFDRVATEEMTDFAWLTEDGTVQQTQFGNGVSVIANFGSQPATAPNGAIVPPVAAVNL